MPSFAEKVIAAHQAGVSERQAAERMQQESETHKLGIQQKKLELDALKLQSALHERSLQALQSGGPTGQATTEQTAPAPTTQPPASTPDSITPPQADPSMAEGIQSLLMKIRSSPVAAQPMPIPTGEPQFKSVPTGLPPAFPDIPVQISDGRTVTIPGTNFEQEQSRTMAQHLATMKLDSMKPFNVAADALHVDPLTGTTISNPKQKDLPALIQEVRSVTPGYDQMTGPQQLQAIAAYQKTVHPGTDTFEEQAAKAWLARPENKGKTIADFNEYNKKIVPAMNFSLNNPGGPASKVAYIADQLALDASPASKAILIGNDKALLRQVSDELARRGTTIDQLTGQTKQLAQTAKDLLPQFDSVLKTINTPEMQAKLGPILGRWNDFEAGKVGKGDPAFAKLRVTVDLLKTGTLRAHFGARGGQGVLERFDGLADAGKMDAPTLSAALEGMRDFLNETYVKPRYGGSADTGNQGTGGVVHVQIPGNPVGTIPASALQQFLNENKGAVQVP